MVGLDRKKAIYFVQRKKNCLERRDLHGFPLRCSFAVSSVLYKAVIILWTKILRNRHNESAISAPPLPPLKEAAGPTITAPLGVPVASAPSLSPTPSCLSLGD